MTRRIQIQSTDRLLAVRILPAGNFDRIPVPHITTIHRRGPHLPSLTSQVSTKEKKLKGGKKRKKRKEDDTF